jgi:hypothetical protein
MPTLHNGGERQPELIADSFACCALTFASVSDW